MTHADLLVNDQGRVTIPAPLRQELGLRPGSRVVAYVENGRLVLEDRDHLLARVQDEVARANKGSTSAVDELIADRRAEAARELAEDEQA
jgi:AbrB family looped-hinge helix DNA binding protein